MMTDAEKTKLLLEVEDSHDAGDGKVASAIGLLARIQREEIELRGPQFEDTCVEIDPNAGTMADAGGAGDAQNGGPKGDQA